MHTLHVSIVDRKGRGCLENEASSLNKYTSRMATPVRETGRNREETGINKEADDLIRESAV